MSVTLVKGYERDIIVFLGAGASAEFGCPVTKTFLDMLSRTLGKEEGKFLDTLRRLHNVKDIEHIIEIIDSLARIDSLSRISSLHGFFEQHQMNVNFGIGDDLVGALRGQFEWRRVIELARTVEKEITDLTFSEYQRRPRHFHEIEEYYRKFFSAVKRHSRGKSEFEIFTTNYDYVIEDYCSQSGHFLKYAVLDQSPKSPKTSSNGENYVYTKLHGSLNWVRNRQTKKIEVIDVLFQVPPYNALYEKNEFVLFGRKPDITRKDEYAAMFDRFKEKLHGASVCIIVGFAFRHEEINEIINDSLKANNSLELFVVSRTPKRAVRKLVPDLKKRSKLIKEKRITYVEGSFGKDKTLTLLETKLNEP